MKVRGSANGLIVLRNGGEDGERDLDLLHFLIR